MPSTDLDYRLGERVALRPNRRKAMIALSSIVMCSMLGCTGSPTTPLETTTGAEGVKKVYASVEDVVKEAPYIFRGRVADVVARRTDDGGNPAGGGIPMVFYSVSVAQYFKAAGPRDSTVTLAWADSEGLAAPVEMGSSYVFLAERLTADQVPGVADLAPMFSPLAGDAGVIDMRGEQLSSHGNAVPEMSTSSRMPWTLDSLSQLLGK